MNKVKNIKFRLTWKGNGCVNYNGSNVTKTLKKSGVDIPYHEVNGKNVPCENVMFGEANYTIDESGNVVRTPKISATCIRNAILKEAEKSGLFIPPRGRPLPLFHRDLFQPLFVVCSLYDRAGNTRCRR